MHLFAVRPIEAVTVANIAEQADMTPAAVYYHYPSKDDLLLDGLREFSAILLAQLQFELDRLRESADIGDVVVALLNWTDERRWAATVYFVTSPGLNVGVEALRRETRIEMVALIAAVLRKRPYALTAADAGAVATGLLALLENAAASWVTEDEVLSSLGRRRLAAEVSRISAAMIGS